MLSPLTSNELKFSFGNFYSSPFLVELSKLEFLKLRATEAVAYIHPEFCFFVDLELEKILKKKRHRLVFDSNDLEERCRGVENVFKYVRGSNNEFFSCVKKKNGVFWRRVEVFFNIERKKRKIL